MRNKLSIGIIAACLIILGCEATAPVSKPLGKLENIASLATNADSELAAATPNIPAARHDVQQIPPLALSAKTDVSQIAKQRDDAKKYIADHSDDWIGPRGHRWIRGICITLIVGVVLLGIADAIASASGAGSFGIAVAGVLAIIGHALTAFVGLIVPGVRKAVAWLASLLGRLVHRPLAAAAPKPKGQPLATSTAATAPTATPTPAVPDLPVTGDVQPSSTALATSSISDGSYGDATATMLSSSSSSQGTS